MACSGACYEMVDTMEYAPYVPAYIVQNVASTCLLLQITAPLVRIGLSLGKSESFSHYDT
jgi:hypothetical protein